MTHTARTATLCLGIAALGLAGLFFLSEPSVTDEHLTYRQVAALTTSPAALPARNYTIQLAPFGAIVINAAKAEEGQIKNVQSLPYPTEYHAQQQLTLSSDGSQTISPITPTGFTYAELGWTIHLSARPVGQLIEVSGEADHVDGQMVNGAYGEIVGQLYDDQGHALAPNKLDQPRIQTTTTHFHVFALPGKPYEVTLYHGDKSEQHILIVRAE